MEDRILSGAVFVVLSAIFGGHGIAALLAAYRTDNQSVWTEKALQGGLGVTAGALFADVVARLFG